MHRIALLVLLAFPSLARAHAMLEAADPPVGSTVSHAPAMLRLDFSEGLEPSFSTVAVTDARAKSVNAGAIHTDPADASHLLVPVVTLPPGIYTVVWHAVSVDTHRTEGSYHFTVLP